MKKKEHGVATSWEEVEKWYSKVVGEEGSYYHQKIIIPGLFKLMGLQETESPSLLDLACGQGILSRCLPPHIPYEGVDISPSLIKTAKKLSRKPDDLFHVGDITKPLRLKRKDYSHATIILALQNVENPLKAFQNAYRALRPGGKLLFVLNHPCFRIPRQTFWGVDEAKKVQYRRVDRYFYPMKIPIQAHPSLGKRSPKTWSFHHPLTSYSQWLHEAGFVIELMEEWCSDKKSTGSKARMEDRSRKEFPLFLAIRAKK